MPQRVLAASFLLYSFNINYIQKRNKEGKKGTAQKETCLVVATSLSHSLPHSLSLFLVFCLSLGSFWDSTVATFSPGFACRREVATSCVCLPASARGRQTQTYKYTHRGRDAYRTLHRYRYRHSLTGTESSCKVILSWALDASKSFNSCS